MKEMEQKRTEEALELVRKKNDLWKYKNEKKDEEMVWASPRNISKYPD